MGNLVTAGQRLTPAVLNRIYGLADTSSATVTANAYTQLSGQYIIPGGDADVGTAYRLTAFGNGTWGSTQQELDLRVTLGGTQLTSSAVAAAAFSASASVRWRYCAVIIVASTGSAGTVVQNVSGEIVEAANPLNPGTASTNAVALCAGQGTTAFNTTISNAFQIEAKWAATTGAPAVTCLGTLFERLS